MDCEKFDQHVMDALYDELDELTHAAMKRHMDGCARCASTFAGLRATRDVGILPLEEPSDDLEARILAAVVVAQKQTPFRRKALRALAWAGSHAMRPQLAMAALFVLVIGSSLLLLRAKPGTVGVAPVRVTERGVPVPEQPEPAPAAEALATDEPPAAAPTAAAAAAPAEPAAVADATEAKRKDEQTKAKADGAADEAGGATAALKEAQTLAKTSGCGAAIGKLDEVGSKYPGTAAAYTAMWEASQCYKASGDDAKARELLMALRSVDGYRDRAEAQLADAEVNAQMQNAAPGNAKAAAAAPARARAAPAAPMPRAAENADENESPARAAPAQRAAPKPAPAPPAAQGLAAPAKDVTDAFY